MNAEQTTADRKTTLPISLLALAFALAAIVALGLDAHLRTMTASSVDHAATAAFQWRRAAFQWHRAAFQWLPYAFQW